MANATTFIPSDQAPLSVLVVDDSAVYRRLLTLALKELSDVQLSGLAGNGVEALNQLAFMPRDLVLLDVEMPELGGLETLKEIHHRWPDIEVIMVSATSTRSAELTMNALECGALAFVAKPVGDDLNRSLAKIRNDFKPLIEICRIRRRSRQIRESMRSNAHQDAAKLLPTDPRSLSSPPRTLSTPPQNSGLFYVPAISRPPSEISTVSKPPMSGPLPSVSKPPMSGPLPSVSTPPRSRPPLSSPPRALSTISGPLPTVSTPPASSGPLPAVVTPPKFSQAFTTGSYPALPSQTSSVPLPSQTSSVPLPSQTSSVSSSYPAVKAHSSSELAQKHSSIPPAALPAQNSDLNRLISHYSSSYSSQPSRSPYRTLAQRPPLVAIGASTGGPKALLELMLALPVLPVPVVVAQHMPATFTPSFAALLQKRTSHMVLEACDNEVLMPGRVYIAPGDRDMQICVSPDNPDEWVIRILIPQEDQKCHPSVDALFCSIAQIPISGVLTVIMTGVGDDGLKGVRMLDQHGSYNLIQNAESCAIFGMPKAIADAGLDDARLSPTNLARRIAELFRVG